MLRMLAKNSKSAEVWSVLPPGVQEPIAGHETAGFYGLVPASELITGEDLASMIGLTAGVSQNSESDWMKFYLDDLLLYIPKKPLRHSISWNQLNDVNAVFGDKELVIKGHLYKVRLLKGLKPGTLIISNTADHPGTHGSEWNRLMYNVAQPLGTEADIRDSQEGEQWENYLQDDSPDGLGLIPPSIGDLNWCQELYPVDTNLRVVRGHHAVSYVTGSSFTPATETAFGWRPCLEHIGPYVTGVAPGAMEYSGDIEWI